jgi:hypothetical protein
VTPFCHTDTPPEKFWKVSTSSRAIVAGRVAAVKTDALVITQNLPHEKGKGEAQDSNCGKDGSDTS